MSLERRKWEDGSSEAGDGRGASAFPRAPRHTKGSFSLGEECCFRVTFDYFLQQDFMQLHSGSFTPNENWCLDMKTTLCC